MLQAEANTTASIFNVIESIYYAGQGYMSIKQYPRENSINEVGISFVDFQDQADLIQVWQSAPGLGVDYSCLWQAPGSDQYW